MKLYFYVLVITGCMLAWHVFYPKEDGLAGKIQSFAEKQKQRQEIYDKILKGE